MPVVALLTLLPVSLNGMGVREWGTVLLLAPLGVGAGARPPPWRFLWFLTFSTRQPGGRRLFICWASFPRFEVRAR